MTRPSCHVIFVGHNLPKIPLDRKCWQPLDQLQNRKANEVQKYPPTYKTWDSPKYPFKYPLEYSKNTKFVFSGYFSGIFRVFFRFLAVGGICLSGWYFCLFWGLWGFLLCSWPVGCQRKWLHYITLFFRIDYVRCNVIVCIDNGLCINLSAM